MRLMFYVLVLITILVGCSSEEKLTEDSATNKVLQEVPKCANNLETINNVTNVKEQAEEFIITVQKDCEPKGGEGPKMRTTYIYKVTSNEVQLIEKDDK
ncbi:hypothetical protein RGU12_21705 [Fredinandcohnia sp. QZ13]|uniref:hypothetical protein n=1 Tax=Fredinandcohnia sp. QZ13 TaxID=3073144 RepID=UPI0028535DDB|nr:hypothetical protein [Fredinandcohnia sp. QZ13]MDR4890117.1 hypothetical protein [Fredinandcohnia sp. QZ13]